MKLRISLIVLAVAALCLAPAYADTLDVVGPSEGLGGTDFAIEISPDGTDGRAFVETDTPNAETVFSAQFRIQATTALRDDLDLNRVLTISTAFGNNVPARNLTFGIQRAANNPNNFRLWVYARNNSTGKLFPYIVFNFTPASDNLARVEWSAGTGADDGIVRIYKNGNLISQRTDVPSVGQDIERIRFGAPVGSVNTGASGAGTYKLDEVELTRTLTP